MYEKLVEELRNSAPSRRLMLTAADAIEEQRAALDAVNDAHNEGFDVGYWAGRRDYEQKWIPVTERVPNEELAFYLCYTDAGIVVKCLWTNNKFGLGPFSDWGWRLMDVPQYQKVTHWMPLPPPPKGEK